MDLPPNHWLLEQARSLSASKDENAVRALAWNLSIAFRRWADQSAADDRLARALGLKVERVDAD